MSRLKILFYITRRLLKVPVLMEHAHRKQFKMAILFKPTTVQKVLFGGIILTIYCLLLYYMNAQRLRVDFYSFYASASAYLKELNPYMAMKASFLANPITVPENLNPPFFLQLISPLAQVSIKTALLLWFCISLVSGIWGALLCFYLTTKRDDFKTYWSLYLFIYLAMYSTLMNTSYGQTGSILLFFITTGYYCFLRNRDYLAGILWGMIIAIKLFPALLFFFVVNQKRYRLFFVMLLTTLLAFLCPLIAKGPEIYQLYIKMIVTIMWQGGNWNASLSGFLFRLFPLDYASQHLLVIKMINAGLSVLVFVWYIKKITMLRELSANHRAFCLTLALMILMSPMGWLYYFSLLLMPLISLWQALNKTSKISVPWIMCIFLLNIPLAYISSNEIDSFLCKISIRSLYFYGLVLLIYLLTQDTQLPKAEAEITQEADIYPILLAVSLALGLFSVLYALLAYLPVIAAI